MLALSVPLPKSPTMIPINTWGLTDLKKHWEKDRQVRTTIFLVTKSKEQRYSRLSTNVLKQLFCVRAIYKVCLIKSSIFRLLLEKAKS